MSLVSTVCQKPGFNENYEIQELGQYNLIHDMYSAPSNCFIVTSVCCKF